MERQHRRRVPRGSGPTRLNGPAVVLFLAQTVRRFWPLVLFPGLAVLFLGGALGKQTFLMRDSFCQMAVIWELIADRIRQGEVPLWNPLVSCGSPLLTDPYSSFFYPPVWIFFLLGTGSALRLIWILHLSVAALGVYGLCRQWKLDRTPSCTAAISFGFATMTVNCLECWPSLGSMALCPVTLLLAERIFQSSAASDEHSWHQAVQRQGACIAALAVTLFLQLAAIAEWFYYSSLLLGLYVGCRAAVSGRQRATFHALTCLATAGVLAALLGSIVILPALEILRESDRASAADAGLQMASAHPRHWLSVLHPFLYGRPGYPTEYWAPGIYEFAWGSCYVGIAPLFLIPLSLRYLMGARPPFQRRFLTLFWLVFLLTTLFLVAGKHTPAYAFLHEHLPGMNKFRFPTKLYFFTTLALALLAGLGTQTLFDFRADAGRRTFRTVLFALSVVVAVIFLATFAAMLHPGFLKALSAHPGQPTPDQASAIVSGLFLSLFFGVGTVAFLLFAFLQPTRALHWSLFLPALTFLDLRLTSGQIHAKVDTSIYDRKPLSSLETLHQEPDGRVFAPQTFSHQYVYGEDRPEILRWAEEAGIGIRYALHGLSEVRPIGLAPKRLHELYTALFSKNPADRERAADLFGIRKFVAAPGYDKVFWGNAPQQVEILKRHAPARVHIVHHWISSPRPDTNLAQLFHPDFNPHQQAVVEGPEPIPDSPSPLSLWDGRETFENKGSRVTQFNDTDWNRILVEASTTSPALLVLNDSWAPGWKVRVNGAPQTVRQVNHAFRGVFLEPGSHRVEFFYFPEKLVTGSALFFSGALGCLALIWCGWRRRFPSFNTHTA